jgi:hypothetical protein
MNPSTLLIPSADLVHHARAHTSSKHFSMNCLFTNRVAFQSSNRLLPYPTSCNFALVCAFVPGRFGWLEFAMPHRIRRGHVRGFIFRNR